MANNPDQASSETESESGSSDESGSGSESEEEEEEEDENVHRLKVRTAFDSSPINEDDEYDGISY